MSDFTLFDMFEDDPDLKMLEEKKKKAEEAKAKEAAKAKKAAAPPKPKTFDKSFDTMINLPVRVVYYSVSHDLTSDDFGGVEQVKADAIRQLFADDYAELGSKEKARCEYEKDNNIFYLALRLSSKGGLSKAVDLNDLETSPHGIYKVRAANGLFKVVKSAIGQTVIQLDDEALESTNELQEGFTPGVKIPVKIIHEFESIAKEYAEQDSEVFGLIMRENQSGEFLLNVPTQQTNRIQAVASLNFDLAKYTLIADIHSHHFMTVSFSPKDDLDDTSPILHLLLHSLNENGFEKDARIGTGRFGLYFPVTWSTVVEEVTEV